MRRTFGAAFVAVFLSVGTAVVVGDSAPPASGVASPIKHIVIFYQENHSFDNLLGRVCQTRPVHCDGVTSGKLSTGKFLPLSQASDIVQSVAHSMAAQMTAINRGLMNGFDRIAGCLKSEKYGCLSQYAPSQIPNTATLAQNFAVSDRTFSQGPYASSMQHFVLLSGGTTDGFIPDTLAGGSGGPGWGCDSGLLNEWKSPTNQVSYQPFCVPAPPGSPGAALEPGAVKTSPVKYIPTLLDRIQAGGWTWKVYSEKDTTQGDYVWATCPLFAECLYGQQSGVAATSQMVADATAGTLPSFSLLLPAVGPTGSTSQHNSDSMTVGDNWIGQVVSAIEHGPDWNSTAIFLTYDDCGCFYDHVAPTAGLGIRVPMIIVSPYAKPGYTDSNVASFSSMIAFTEHTLGLPPLSPIDAMAYDYRNAFDFTQPPRTRIPLVQTPVPGSSTAYLKTYPPNPSDPT
jgi:phospholipase C